MSGYVVMQKKKEKNKRRGRYKGGFIIRKIKNWDRLGNSLKVKEVEGMVLSEINLKKEKLSIVSIYNTGEEKKIREKIDKELSEELEKKILLRGDFNLRLGELGTKEIEGERLRCSKDNRK